MFGIVLIYQLIMILMTLNDLVYIVDKVHRIFYGNKAIRIDDLSDDVKNIIYEDDQIKVDNAISKTRFRLTFNKYEGKIDDYSNLFGEILKNNKGACDTGYLVDLSYSQVQKIYDFIKNNNDLTIQSYKVH